jgi:type IV secretion system protein VirB5
VKKLAFIAALVVVPVTARADVPVIDFAANLNILRQYAQDIKSYTLQSQQYLTQAQQLAQQVQQYNALVQNPSLGAATGLMSQTGLSNSLPINPSGLVGLTSGYSMSLSGLAGRLSALNSLANTAYSQNHVYACTDNSWSCQQQQQRAYGLAGVSGIAQAAYQDLRNHMPVVQALRDQAASATTPAQRENVLVQMQAETAWHDNLVAQLNAAQMQAAVDNQYAIQRDDERMSRDIEATIQSIPGG